jgi:hypothetical protein
VKTLDQLGLFVGRHRFTALWLAALTVALLVLVAAGVAT